MQSIPIPSVEITDLSLDIEWCLALLRHRIASTFGLPKDAELLEDLPAPALSYDSAYSRFVREHKLSLDDRLLLVLAVLPVLRPEALDFLRGTDADKAPVTVFGGHPSVVHRGFLPTVQTALFLVSGVDLAARAMKLHRLSGDHPLIRGLWVTLVQTSAHEPITTALLSPSRDLIDMITSGKPSEPEFGPGFPAQRVETGLEWHDLVLDEEVLRQVDDIRQWIEHQDTIMKHWRLGQKLAPGFRCLFYGPPGTGKTLTATLLGKATGCEVYRIDLSMVVSKYIGETEKNLRAVFDKAQSRGWILFFDEADALFGKRTDVGDSKDRYANQEVSYLLQRVENFDGVVILATNNRDNMDKAFTRRFQVVVPFAMPTVAERLKIWKGAIPSAWTLGPSLDLLAVADRYELAGGSIMNVVRYCALRAAVRGDAVLQLQDLLDGVRIEYRKAGRMLQ